MTTATPASTGYRTYVLVLLILIYMFNFLDRQIVGILAVPIMKDLELTRSQMGLMGGIAFAALYCTLAIPLAWLADRFSRVWIMTGALAVWSGFTALCVGLLRVLLRPGFAMPSTLSRTLHAPVLAVAPAKSA